MAVRGQKAQLSARPRRRASVARCILMSAGFCRATAWERRPMIDNARVCTRPYDERYSDWFLFISILFQTRSRTNVYYVALVAFHRND